GLRALDPVPCWTRVHFWEGYSDREAWDDFQRRRVAKVAELPQPRRREVAMRFISDHLGDVESVLLAELPELEEVRTEPRSSVTGAGRRRVAAMPNLRAVSVGRRLDSLEPLAECPTLEQFSACSGRWEDESLHNEDTAGLERMTNLRTLCLMGSG